MTSKLRSEGEAGASQDGVDGKEVLGSRGIIQGEESSKASAKVSGRQNKA